MSRPTKRARVQQQPASAAGPARKREPLFAPFRSLGHVSTGVPFVLQSRASKHLQQPALTVITSLGASWVMWEGQSMRLLFVGAFASLAGVLHALSEADRVPVMQVPTWASRSRAWPR